ncbi:MAG: UDP-2,3-diacylglucosamine diphosphatase [Gammaproteobacteria bacterium]
MPSRSNALFISDLHLSAERPAMTELFLNFVGGEARRAQALYILGDLFEVWLGDDDNPPEHQRIIAALRALSDSGTQVYVMHGNRDFLLGETFASASGCRLLPEACIIDLAGTSTLLMHGDTLCTDDTDYQQFRQMVRNPQWQQQFLSLPLAERQRLAQGMRAESRLQTSKKSDAIMDVNQQAVAQTMLNHKILRLIHGHTHRPAVHDFQINGQPAQRIVLGDWYEQGSALWCDGEGCRTQLV